MLVARYGYLAPCFFDGSGDFGTVSGDNAAVTDVHFGDALPHSDDQGLVGEEAERLAGEADRGETRRNNHERSHLPPEIDWPAVKVTLVNIRRPQMTRYYCVIETPAENALFRLAGSNVYSALRNLTPTRTPTF